MTSLWDPTGEGARAVARAGSPAAAWRRWGSVGLLGALALAAAFLQGGGAGAQAPASAPGTPTITVVGFGVVPDGGGTGTGYQITWNLQGTAPQAGAALEALQADVARARALLEPALAKADLPASDLAVQGGPWLNYQAALPPAKCQAVQAQKPGWRCPTGAVGYAANESLVLTLPDLAAAVRFLDLAQSVTLPGQTNMFFGEGGPGPTPPPSGAALGQAYAQALAEARATAALVAQADGLALGPQLSVQEGAPGQASCGAMGACQVGIAPGVLAPTPGPGQMLVAVTVTYATAPAGA